MRPLQGRAVWLGRLFRRVSPYAKMSVPCGDKFKIISCGYLCRVAPYAGMLVPCGDGICPLQGRDGVVGTEFVGLYPTLGCLSLAGTKTGFMHGFCQIASQNNILIHKIGNF
jgi:hypothetical protein